MSRLRMVGATPQRPATTLSHKTRADTALWEALDAIAEREERSKIGVIRLALRRYCEIAHPDLLPKLRPKSRRDDG